MNVLYCGASRTGASDNATHEHLAKDIHIVLYNQNTYKNISNIPVYNLLRQARVFAFVKLGYKPN